ncbi:MAG: TolC family protein [Nitrospira sp.]
MMSREQGILKHLLRLLCILWSTFVVDLAIEGSSVFSQSQDVPPSPLTLDHAIQFGIDHYPSVRSSLARVAAAKAGVDLTRTAYLPRLDIGYQGSMASFNNVSGVFFPNAFTLPASGADLQRKSYAGTWGSAGGVVAGWEPFDFGLRAANVETARATERQSAAGVNLTKLDVGIGVGEAFVSLIMMEQAVEAMQANVDRRKVFAETVAVLVKSKLRPGVDSSRATAEEAMARTQLIQAEQAREVARATLAEVLGAAGVHIEVQSAPLLHLPVLAPLPDPAPWTHPLAIAQSATADVFRKRKEAYDSAWVPRVELQGAFFGRGSGWDDLGNRTNGAGALLPDVPNWAGGATVTFSLFDFASLRSKRSIEHYNEQAERAAYDQALQALTGKHAKAVENVKAAYRIADNTPIQLSASRDTEAQTKARYRAGLATVIEVAEAQQLLVQASIDDALAHLGVWRALLGLSGAQGDLQPFLEQLRISMRT